MSGASLQFHLSEHHITLRTRSPAALRGLEAVWQSCERALVDPRSSHLVEARETGERSLICVDGEVVDVAENAADVLPVLDRALYVQLGIWSDPDRALLHAASLVGRDAAILITGPSGSGKSSLAWAGIEHGYLYAGDEVCVSDGERLWGVPRAVLYDPTLEGRSLPAWIRGADTERYRFMHAQGEPCFLPLRQPAPSQLAQHPWPLSQTHVVLAQRGDTCALECCEPLEALALLYRERWGGRTVPLAPLVHRSRCWRLRWDDPGRAWELLRRAITGPVAS